MSKYNPNPARGERCAASKLTAQIVQEIRRRNDAGYKRLARAYGVSTSTIYQIKTRKTWRHIP